VQEKIYKQNKDMKMKTLIVSMAAMLLLIPNCMKAQTKGTNNKTLIVYYSRSGNTETVAKHIQELTGADMFRVETAKAYPEEYQETTKVAQEEKNNNARPEIKGKVGNIDQYETIFIGFPIWWGTFPMALATFIESYNLEGKTIVPFCTHGGGGVSQGFKNMQTLAPKANHKEGLSLSGSRASSSRGEVEKWLKEVKVID